MTPSEVRETAVRMVGSRALSKAELMKKLLDKGAEEADARAAVEFLTELGALDDKAYAGAVVRHYGRRGYGTARIRQELSRRGIPREYWEEAFEELPPAEDALASYIRKKTGGQPIGDEKQLRKIRDGLLRRGFSWSEVREALSAYASAIDDFSDDF